MTELIHQWLRCMLLFAQMIFFKGSPSKLPYSPHCLALTLLAYIITGQILLGDQRSLISIVAQIALELAILYAISFIILKYKNKTGRLLQTLTALAGVSLMIGLLSIPVLYLLPGPSGEDQINPIVLQINLFLLLWNLAVISLIFKRSFEINTLTAAFIAFNYFLLYELLLLNIF
jgi:hypothetical protein